MLLAHLVVIRTSTYRKEQLREDFKNYNKYRFS